MIDDCKEHPDWTRKIEEELGQNIAMLTLTFDESVRDELVERSPLYKRFVRIHCHFKLSRTKKSKSSSSEETQVYCLLATTSSLYLN